MNLIHKKSLNIQVEGDVQSMLAEIILRKARDTFRFFHFEEPMNKGEDNDRMLKSLKYTKK